MRSVSIHRQWRCVFIGLAFVACSSTSFAGLRKPGEVPDQLNDEEILELPKPGELPKAPKSPKPAKTPDMPDTSELLKVPEFPLGAEARMPLPGHFPGPLVACVQAGKMDITRPSLPLLSCWESAVADGETIDELQKACNVQMSPMKIKSTLVPKCLSKALGVCIGALSGSASGKKSSSDHYHYTPQTLFEWQKAKKNCEKSDGEWFGLGNPKSWF